MNSRDMMKNSELFEQTYNQALKEQLYTNSRPYYIGTKYKKVVDKLPLSTHFTDIPIIWLTTDEFMAMNFAASKEGVIYRVKLNKYLHIFNARSNEDIAKIKKQMPSITEDQINNMAHLDFYIWESGKFQGFEKDRSNRDLLISQIKKIKYGSHNQFNCDGFLNFEKDYKDVIYKNKNPGLGLFSNDSFKIIESCTYEKWQRKYEWYKEQEKKPALTEQERKYINKVYYGIE